MLVVTNLARLAVGEEDREDIGATSRASTNRDAHDQCVTGVTGHDCDRARVARNEWIPIEAGAVDHEGPCSSGDGVAVERRRGRHYQRRCDSEREGESSYVTRRVADG